MTLTPEVAKVALVTGGSRGIGRAIALGLAEDGYDVVVNYRRDADAADDAVRSIESLGRRCVAVPAAVEDPASCAELAERAVAAFGQLNVLVSNAGVASRGLSVAETDPAELERVVRTHAFAPHRLCQLLLPELRKRDCASVVVVSSTVTRDYPANGAPYNMGKAALEALAFTLAREERHHGVRVNVVAPGLVATDMGTRLAAATMGVADVYELDEKMPFGRVCRPEDVAAVVRWVVSPAASYVTGERINVDGGGP